MMKALTYTPLKLLTYNPITTETTIKFVDDPDMGEDHDWLFDDYDNYGFNDQGAGI